LEGPYRKALVNRVATGGLGAIAFRPQFEGLVPSNSVALEYAEATELYTRLAKELLTYRKSASYAEYEAKLLELDAARERCAKARQALRAARIKRRQQS
jgi:hypothetical protein